MAKNNSRKIRVSNLSYIAPLCQHGPIVTPIYVDETTAYKLVQRGYNVIEVDPLNGKECNLSISNFFKSDRFNPKTETESSKNEALKATVTGKNVVGKAVPVNTIAKDDAIPFDTIINSTKNSFKSNDNNSSEEKPAEEKPTVPFINNQMSKAERKALARKQREAERAAAEAEANAKAEAEAKAAEETTEVADSNEE